MGRRLIAWVLTLPVAAAGVLVAHDLAYRLTGVAGGPTHAYLAHAPQVLAILVLFGVFAFAFQARGGSPSAAPFALLSMGGFVVQEHVERVVHDGALPFLLTERTFLLGLLLQVPVAVACTWIVRRVLGALRAPARRSPPRISRLRLALAVPCVEAASALAPAGGKRSRAPPLDLGR